VQSIPFLSRLIEVNEINQVHGMITDHKDGFSAIEFRFSVFYL